MRVRPARGRDRGRGRRGARAGRPERGGGGGQRRLRRGLLVLDRGGAGGDRRALRRARADAGRPAGRDGGDRARAAGRPRRRGAGGVPLRRRARAPDRVRALDVRRARGPARRQGRVEAGRPVRRGRSDRRPHPARRRHPRGLRGGPVNELAQLAPDVETLARRLATVDYLVDEGLATSMFLSLRLPQPLLLEGEAGVGKTEAAKSLAAVLDTPLVRLQCYEGIDATEALYE